MRDSQSVRRTVLYVENAGGLEHGHERVQNAVGGDSRHAWQAPLPPSLLPVEQTVLRELELKEVKILSGYRKASVRERGRES